MLVQVVAQGTGQGAQLSRGHVAGKTGTTQNYRDAWFIGYNDRLITGVWMGNDDNTPMERVSGGRYPARLWREYMEDGLSVSLPRAAEFSDSDSYAPSSSGGGDFYNMLEQWSSGFGGEKARTESGPVPSTEYNQ
jgi:penicillin-binding protein 1A